MTDKTAESAPRPRTAVSGALLAIIAFWAVAVGVTGRLLGAVEAVNPEGAQWALAFTAALLLGLALATMIAGQGRLAALVRTTFLAATLCLALLVVYAGWSEQSFAVVLTSVPALVAVLGGLFAIVFLSARRGAAPLPRALLAALVAVSVFGAGQLILRPAPLLIAAEATPALAFVAPVEPREYALAQDILLDGQIAALADGRNGKPELFALLAATYAGQSVFVSEAEGVRAILDGHYGIGPRSLLLGNSERAPLKYPEADWPNLDRALAALSGQMGPEDVLFLFLTSHGNTDVLSLTFHPAAGRTDTLQLDAVGLADLLDQHVTNPVLAVISACKSGSFIDDLAADDRLIITASAADRVSFGCKDGADWTYFGKEFFDTALRQEPDPRKAFAAALPLIEAAEAKLEWAKPSQPQIQEGPAFGAALDRIVALGQP